MAAVAGHTRGGRRLRAVILGWGCRIQKSLNTFSGELFVVVGVIAKICVGVFVPACFLLGWVNSLQSSSTGFERKPL